jgi:hypothetical protein
MPRAAPVMMATLFSKSFILGLKCVLHEKHHAIVQYCFVKLLKQLKASYDEQACSDYDGSPGQLIKALRGYTDRRGQRPVGKDRQRGHFG